ncbi:MAG: alpha-L-arabinofuranosidase C-terminal domain-containing protein [bacterium]
MANTTARVIVLGRKRLGRVHDGLFGQFIELAGRCINNGLYDPASSQARADGVRADVLDALRQLRPGFLRYPGGCAASYFDWQELVGPKESRPRAKLFRATNVPQSTAFGIPEAWSLCQELGAELYLTVNAHTQSPEDAANLVEYLNSTAPTRYADLRRSHGREEPYGVKLFGLGNEIYGNWQAGRKTASEYAAWCAEAILQMKRVDPAIRVVVCGLGRPDPEWDRTVLFRLIGQADMISMHNYFGRPVFADSMAASRICEQYIAAANHLIDEAMDIPLGVHSRAHRELGGLPVVSRRPGIAFDEWNVWYRTGHDPVRDLEEIYNYTDALTVASLLHVVLRNAKTIDLSCISLAVNTLGSIFTDRDRLVRQTIWYPQQLLRDTHAGCVVETVVDGPVFKARHERFFCGIVDPEKAKDETRPSLVLFDDVEALDVVATVDDARRKLTLSIVQKLSDSPLTVSLDLRGVTPCGEQMTVHRLTGGDNLLEENTLDHPHRVGTTTERVNLATTITLPPASLTVLEMELADSDAGDVRSCQHIAV